MDDMGRTLKLLTQLPCDARPAWAEVSLHQIWKNFQAIQRRVGRERDVMAVVKANAYGHGAVPVARFLASHGVRWFGVATLEEALELRHAGIGGQLLLLGTFFPAQASAALEEGIQVTASSLTHLDALNRAAEKRKRAPVHLKFDTGMGRLGFSLDQAEPMARAWAKGRWHNLRLCGVSSHLASAEEVEGKQNHEQTSNFLQVLSAFEEAGVEIPIRHLANSAGLAFHSRLRWDLVRAGIALYGYEPRRSGRPPMGTAPALSLKTRVLHVKKVARGAALGYDATFVTRRPSVIATLPIGYADGVSRRLSFSNVKPFSEQNAGRWPMEVLIRGRRAPIVGRVSMDLTLVDATGVPGVRVSDEVVLMSPSRSQRITAQDWAAYVGTIPYEVLCALGSRVYRIYRK